MQENGFYFIQVKLIVVWIVVKNQFHFFLFSLFFLLGEKQQPKNNMGKTWVT